MLSHAYNQCLTISTTSCKMVNCKISPDRKLCALHLWKHGWTIEDFCVTLCISQSSLYCWQHIFNEPSAVTKPPSNIIDHLRLINHAVLTAVHTIYEEDSDLYLDELITPLAVEHQVHILKSTLSCNLINAGLTRKVLQKLAKECDEVLREDWKEGLCNDLLEMDQNLSLLTKLAKMT